MHEIHEKAPHRAGGQSSDRTFGLLFAAVFFTIALIPLHHHLPIRYWALAVSGIFLGAAVLTPSLLGPVNRLWTALGLLLGRIVSPVALGILFFCGFVLWGWIVRRAGKDLLRLQRRPTLKSYWIVRSPSGPSPESLKNQF